MPALSELLQSGGPVVWLLLVLSFASICLIIVKALQMRGATSGLARRDEAISKWTSGDRAAAEAMLDNGPAPADRILQSAMQAVAAGQGGATLDASLEWRGNLELASLQRHIRLLELVAMVSPLLGLLGTVLGMIEAFQQLAMAEGAANAALLAGGIWQALLTTAAGLIVAIPAAVAASLLSEKVDRAAGQIEAAAGRFLSVATEGPGK